MLDIIYFLVNSISLKWITDLLPPANEVAARYCFQSCLSVCSWVGGSWIPIQDQWPPRVHGLDLAYPLQGLDSHVFTGPQPPPPKHFQTCSTWATLSRDPESGWLAFN